MFLENRLSEWLIGEDKETCEVLEIASKSLKEPYA
jgi:hypothetical protein